MGSEQEPKKERKELDENEVRFLGALGGGDLYPGGFYADHPYQLKPARDERAHRAQQNALAFD